MKNDFGRGLSPVAQKVYDRVREEIAFYDRDREIVPDIKAIEALIRSDELTDIIKGFFEDME